MFNTLAYSGVDAIQTAKKQFVSTFVQHEQLKSLLNGFVDAQAAYTKSAIDSGIKTFTQAGEILMDRTPYVNLSETISSYFPTLTTAAPATAKKSKKAE